MTKTSAPSIFESLQLPSPSRKVSGKINVQVLGIFRYLAAPEGASMLGYDPSEWKDVTDLYDVVLCDGIQKIKALLAPEMSAMVASGEVEVLDTININQWRAHKSGDSIYPILEEISVSRRKLSSVIFEDSKRAIKWNKAFMKKLGIEKVYDFKPLVPMRYCYRATYTDDCLPFVQHSLIFTAKKDAIVSQAEAHASSVPTSAFVKQSEPDVLRIDDGWSGDKIGDDAFTVSAADLAEESSLKSHLTSLADKAQSSSVFVNDVILTGKVVQKGPVSDFSSPRAGQVLPLQFDIILADSTRSVKVTFWNSLCRRYFGKITLGSIIAIANFRYKVKSEEISLNPSKDEEKRSRIVILKASGHKTLSERFLVPIVNAICYASNIVAFAAGTLNGEYERNQLCSCIGVVTFVGRMERTLGADGQFYGYRWVRVRDFTHELQETAIQLYINSQYNVIARLEVGSLLLATSLKACVTVSSSNVHQLPLSICLRSSKYSSYFINPQDISSVLGNDMHYPKIVLEKCNRLQDSVERSHVISKSHDEEYLSDNTYETTLKLTPFFYNGSLRRRFSVIPEVLEGSKVVKSYEDSLKIGQQLSIRVRGLLRSVVIDDIVNPQSMRVDLIVGKKSLEASVQRDMLFTRFSQHLSKDAHEQPIETMFNYIKLVFDPMDKNIKSSRSRKRKRIKSDFNIMDDVHKALEIYKIESKVYWISMFRKSSKDIERKIKAVY